MSHASLPVLFASSDCCAVVDDPVNQDWVAVMRAIEGPRFDRPARRSYQALQHFRKRPVRCALPGTIQLQAHSRQQAFEGLLSCIEERKAARKRAEEAGEPFPIFGDAWANQQDESLPRALADFSVPPLPFDVILDGPGRPLCDALCLLRAFLAAPLLIGADGPTAVHRLLHSNPAFAELAGFCGRGALKQAGELTSRRLPSEAVCEEFSEVMTRYGLWQLCRIEQVQANIARGARR